MTMIGHDRMYRARGPFVDPHFKQSRVATTRPDASSIRTSTLVLLAGISLAAEASAQITRLHLTAASAGTDFGRSVAAIGDVNSDSFDDILVGEPLFDSAGGTQNVGRFTIYSGISGAVLFQVEGTQTGERLGSVVEGMYDPKAAFHSWSHYAIAAPGRTTTVGGVTHHGAVDCYDESFTLRWTSLGSTTPTEFGASIEFCPSTFDVDNFGEWAIGDTSSGGTGAVFIVSSIDGSVMGSIAGTQTGESFGAQIAWQGDANLDGYHELWIGAPDYFGPLGQTQGQIRRFDLIPISVGVVSAALAVGTIDGALPTVRLGSVMSGGGDLDGDGRFDLVAGVPTAGSASGVVEVFLGSNTTGTPDATITAATPVAGERFGASVALMATATSSGSSATDVIIGSPHATNPLGTPLNRAGRVDVVSGSAALGGGAATPYMTAYGAAADDQLGMVVGAAGDVDGSLFSDVIAAAPKPGKLVPGQPITAIPFVTVYEALACPGSKRAFGIAEPAGTSASVDIVEPAPLQCNTVTVRMTSSSSTASMTGLLLYNTSYLAQPQPAGGTIYVNLAPPCAIVPFTLPAAPANLQIPYPLPCGTTFCGTHIFMQLIVPDASLPAGAAFSRGYQLTIG